MPRSCRDWAGASLVLLPFRRSFDLEIDQVLSAERRRPSLPERSPGRGSRRYAEGDASATDGPHSSMFRNDILTSSPANAGEVSASHTDGGVMSVNDGAHDP